MVMKAIVLAGGKIRGGRFPPNSKPKCLYHVGGEMILDRIIRCLRSEGVHNIRVVTGYRREDIEHHDKKHGLDLELVYTPYWETSAMKSLEIALSDIDDDILLMYGDILLRRDVIRGFLMCKAPLAWIYTLKPYREYQNELQDGHQQICIIKVAKEKLPIFNDMEKHWQTFLKRRPRYSKFGPDSAFVLDGVMAEAMFANRPIGRVKVNFVPDIDWYDQTDEAPWHMRHTRRLGRPLMKIVRKYLK